MSIVAIHKGGTVHSETKKICNGGRLITDDLISILEFQAEKMGAEKFRTMQDAKENINKNKDKQANTSISDSLQVNKLNYFEKGNKMYELGRYEQAVQQYREAIKINPHYKLAI